MLMKSYEGFQSALIQKVRIILVYWNSDWWLIILEQNQNKGSENFYLDLRD